MAQKDLKEAFVSNLNGTSLGEVALGSFLSPVCFMNRGLIFILCQQIKGSLPLPFPTTSHLLLDFCVLILPLVLSCTILSSVLLQVAVSLMFALASMFLYIYGSSLPARRSQRSVSGFLQSRTRSNRVPFVTLFRVFVNVNTAISILAVDFAVFPRRYAKTETYGTGVMDYGVGGFVFANALVCPEARRKNVSGSRMSRFTKQVLSVWPLLALGAGRLASVKIAGYHEHVTEYGVHWNFFFTLAIVRVLASGLLTVLPARHLWVFSLLISGFYQFILETSELKAFILHNEDREKDFVHANKEGIFSLAGYVSIYLTGVQIGLYVMQPRSRVGEWLRVLSDVFLGSLVLFAALCVCQTLVEPVSRRSANFPFFLWSLAQSLFFMSCFGLADVLLLFLKRTSGCHVVPASLNVFDRDADESLDRKRGEMEKLCLVQAVSRNQLVFFLLSNVTTGLTNSLLDTLSCSSLVSVCVLLLYMFVNCLVIYVLHVCGVTVKFW